MTSSNRHLATLVLVAGWVFAAVAVCHAQTYDSGRPDNSGPPSADQKSVEMGVVESIDMNRDGQPAPTGLGAILGGVAGGVIGHQIGSGRGNTAATIAGAVGGAAVGNQVEKAQPRDRYRVIVRLDSGETIAFNEVGEGELRVGDRVRVVNNRVHRV